MTIPYILPLDEPGLLTPASPYAAHLRASDLNVYGARRGAVTFARASEGVARCSDGAVVVAAHSQSRFDYFDLDGDGEYETATLALDGAHTNLCARGADWSYATLTNATRTMAADALGELSLAKINDADAVNQGYAQTPNCASRFTTNGNGVLLVQFAAPDVAAASGYRIYLWDTTAGAARAGLTVTWSGGVATVTGNTGTLLWSRLAGMTKSGRRVYEAAVKATGTLTTNDHAVRAAPAGTAAQTGDLYIGYASVEDVTTAPLPMIVNAGSGSAAYVAETWSLPFDAPPQAMSIFLDFVEFGTRHQASGTRILSLGNATPGTPELYVDVNGSGVYRVTHHNGTSSVNAVAGSSGGSAIPNVGQQVQLYVTLAATGAVSIEQSIDGAAWSTTVTSGALTLATAWAGFSGSCNLYLGHPYANRQALRLVEGKVSLGTIARAVFEGA